MKGRHLALSTTSSVEMPRTSEDSDSCMKEQIWQFGSVQSGAFRLAKSMQWGLADKEPCYQIKVPVRCWRLTWYLLTVVEKEVTHGLAENSPRQSFCRA